MPTRTKDQNTHHHGTWNVLCDVCGFKFKNVDIKKRWDGLMVCFDDWEPRHESDFQHGVTDDPSVPYTRPDQAETGATDITGTTFPITENVLATNIGYSPVIAVNLFQYSEDFSQWTENPALAATVFSTDSAVAPDGTTTADVVQDNSVLVHESVYSNAIDILPYEIYTGSIYVKKDAVGIATRHVGFRLWITGGTDGFADIRLDTSTGDYLLLHQFNDVLNLGGGVIDTGDYWRIWVIVQNNNSGNDTLRCYFYPGYGKTAFTNVTVATTGSATIWGAQLVPGPTLTNYIRTTDVLDTSIL